MSKGKNGGWKLGFCECFKEITPCLLICCCGNLGLGIVHYLALKNGGITTPSPIVGCLASCCCGSLGAAYVRQAIRKDKKLPAEHYCYDCGAYSSGCWCCMGAQDFHETKK